VPFGGQERPVCLAGTSVLLPGASGVDAEPGVPFRGGQLRLVDGAGMGQGCGGIAEGVMDADLVDVDSGDRERQLRDPSGRHPRSGCPGLGAQVQGLVPAAVLGTGQPRQALCRPAKTDVTDKRNRARRKVQDRR
jgi:hypothetical protein